MKCYVAIGLTASIQRHNMVGPVEDELLRGGGTGNVDCAQHPAGRAKLKSPPRAIVEGQAEFRLGRSPVDTTTIGRDSRDVNADVDERATLRIEGQGQLVIL